MAKSEANLVSNSHTHIEMCQLPQRKKEYVLSFAPANMQISRFLVSPKAGKLYSIQRAATTPATNYVRR